MQNKYEFEDLSKIIIGAAIEVHKTLGGPGMLESIYEDALFFELQLRGLKPKKQIPIRVSYKGATIRDPLIMDIIVNDKIIIEVKALEKINSLHESQLLTYLRISNLQVGLLINFGKKTLKEGLSRVVNYNQRQ